MISQVAGGGDGCQELWLSPGLNNGCGVDVYVSPPGDQVAWKGEPFRGQLESSLEVQACPGIDMGLESSKRFVSE